jgi:CheY-like chemotaxis protein
MHGAIMLAERKTVLVVDDDEDTRNGIADLLELLGHDVFTAASAPEAIGIFVEHEPDFVCIDIGLPGMTGHELATRLRTLAGSRRVRLIALSGWSQPEVIARSYAAGMDLHIVKPVGVATLRGLVGDAAGLTDEKVSWTDGPDRSATRSSPR